MTETLCATCEPSALVPETNLDFAFELSRGFAGHYIRRKAREINRQTARWLWDVDDLTQDLTLQLLESLPQFKPEQGCFNAFVKLVVDRDAANLKRDLTRELLERGDENSLSTLVVGADGTPEPLGNTISDRELDARRGQQTRPWQDALESEHDVAAVVGRLPVRLKDLSQRLMEASPTQVARDVSLSRTMVYELIRRVRTRFAAAGLGAAVQIYL